MMKNKFLLGLLLGLVLLCSFALADEQTITIIKDANSSFWLLNHDGNVKVIELFENQSYNETYTIEYETTCPSVNSSNNTEFINYKIDDLQNWLNVSLLDVQTEIEKYKTNLSECEVTLDYFESEHELCQEKYIHLNNVTMPELRAQLKDYREDNTESILIVLIVILAIAIMVIIGYISGFNDKIKSKIKERSKR